MELTKESIKEMYQKGFDETRKRAVEAQYNHKLEKRFKFVFIDLEAILYYVFQGKETYDCYVLNFLQLPEGAEPLGAYYDPERHGFKVLIYSLNFEIVDYGERTPEIDYKMLAVKSVKVEGEGNE